MPLPRPEPRPILERQVGQWTSYQGLFDHLAASLRPQRFLHVLGVTHTAVQLAERHGLDRELAAAAGLIHDRSKHLEPREIEADLSARGVEIPEEDRPFPAIWHGLHAAVWLRQDSDWAPGPGLESLIEAIRHHSTAEAGLGPLGRLLFVADFVEPGRDFESVDALRVEARKDLDAAFKSCLAAKCRHMVKKGGMAVHPAAKRALDQCGVNITGSAGVVP